MTSLQSNENIAMALDSVRANKFRSGLTVLGIVIGITTVVTVSSLLTGLRQGVVTFFEEFGPDNVFLKRYSGDPGSNGSLQEQKRRPMNPIYADLIRRMAPSVKDVSTVLTIPGIVNGRPMSARVAGFETENINLAGVSPNAYQVQPRELTGGRFFTPEESQRGMKVAMLGANISKALFPSGSALGKTFFVDGGEFTVVGIMEPAKGGFFGENGIDNQISMPIRTAQMRYPQIDRWMFVVQSYPGMRQQAFDEVENLLRKLRRNAPGQPNDFDITTPDQIVAQFDKITGVIGLISIAISALGLLVGGIGVMNIMLVSVTERTREIGVRKAVGARRFDIVLQFMMEAITLTGIGGLIGIVFSIAVTFAVGALVPALPSVVPAWAVLTGVVVSVMVGVFFGVWPAFKAAKLDPVEALRYE